MIYEAIASVAPGFETWGDLVRFLGLGAELSNEHATARALLLFAIWKVHNMLRRQRTPTGFTELDTAKYIWAVLRNEFVISHKANRCRPFFQSPTVNPPPAPALVDVGGDQ